MAAGILGFLRVNLALDSGQFGAGAKSARRELAAISTAAKATGAAIAAFGAAMGAFAASSAGAAVELQGMARGANASLAEFQRAAHGAKVVGVEQAQLADILRDVNDRVGDFLATGGGEMADFFETIAPKVGVTAEQFRKLSGPDALQLFVSSLEAAGVSQQEMIFYLEAMASDASKLLPLLTNGGAEMARLGTEAERFGLLNEQAAASGRAMREAMATMSAAVTAVGAALANSGLVDAMARLVRVAAEFIGLKIAPAVRSMAEAMAAALNETAPLGRALAALGDNMDRIATYAATAAAIFGGRLAVGLALSAARVLALVGGMKLLRFAIIRTGIGALIVGAGELVYQFMRLAKGAGGTGEAIGLLGNVVTATFAGMARELDAVTDGWAAFGLDLHAIWLRTIRSLANAWSDFVNRIGVTFNEISRRAGSALRIDGVEVGAWASSFDAAVIRAEASAERLRAGKLAKLQGAWEELDAAIGAVRDAFKDAGTDGDDAAKRIKDASKTIEDALAGLGDGDAGESGGAAAKPAKSKIRAEIERTADSVRTLEDELKTTLGSGLSRAFDGLISGGMKFRDVLAGIVTDLAKMAANRLIGQLLDQVVGAAIGAFTLAAPTTSPIPIPRPAFASGTQFAPGGLSLVGERGPEMVNLPQGAQVIPNHRLPAAATQIHVDARGAMDPAAVEAAALRAFRAMAPGISRAAIFDMRRRGEI